MESALGREVTFTAFLQGEALARLFAYCDIFVFPSATDTLGRAVVYDIGGPRECIRPGETGFGDEKEFFEKLELLVDDAALRRRMGRAAREFATTLSWRAVLQGVLDIHLGLAEGSAPPRVPAES
jgi:glycosyltransferase involved in cell wall biosynthesis